jgi:hypothetical protein
LLAVDIQVMRRKLSLVCEYKTRTPTLLAKVMLLFVMFPQRLVVSVKLELNLASLRIPLLLALFLAEFAVVVLVSVMLVEGIRIVVLFTAEVAELVLLVFVLVQLPPFEQGLLEDQHRLFIQTQIAKVRVMRFVHVAFKRL